MSILLEGKLRGAQVPGSDLPVVCFSEPSEEARRVMLRTGVSQRGPYEPWGLVFDREALLEIGVRPVMYLSNAEMDLTSSLPDKSRNRRVRYEPGTADWLHEREWRLCFTKETAQSDEAHLTITKDLTIGVIVGEQGWHPPARHHRRNISLPKLPLGVSAFGYATHTWFAGAADGLKRWWWNGQDLVEDGVFEIGEQMQIAAAYGEEYADNYRSAPKS
ncbi:hypothetical protein [Kitasatospora sp. NPDC057223]|uniref:hypothetical protein n=1 Tax=Kitasatospora sp. NPDC057223 TaxID=3346055 RepID=UPI00362A94BF